jgi:hypothetical protein
MDDMRVLKKVFHSMPRGRREIGCPRKRLEVEARTGKLPLP